MCIRDRLFALSVFSYWLDQATFAMSRKYYPYLPPLNDPAWQWPRDLLMPDVLFYIEDCPMSNLTRKPNVYRHL